MKWAGGEAICPSLENSKDPAMRYRLGLPPLQPSPRGSIAQEYTAAAAATSSSSSSSGSVPGPAKAFAAARAMAQMSQMMNADGKGSGGVLMGNMMRNIMMARAKAMANKGAGKGEWGLYGW